MRPVTFMITSAFSSVPNLTLACLTALALTACSTAPANTSQSNGYFLNQEQTVQRGGVGNYLFRDSAPVRVITEQEHPMRSTQSSPSRPFAGKTLYFSTGKSSLSAVQKKDLNSVVVALKRNPDLRVRIGGYTDSTGTPEINTKLSQARADTVRKYLRQYGIASVQIESATGTHAVQSDSIRSRSEDARARKAVITGN